MFQRISGFEWILFSTKSAHSWKFWKWGELTMLMCVYIANSQICLEELDSRQFCNKEAIWFFVSDGEKQLNKPLVGHQKTINFAIFSPFVITIFEETFATKFTVSRIRCTVLILFPSVWHSWQSILKVKYSRFWPSRKTLSIYACSLDMNDRVISSRFAK